MKMFVPTMILNQNQLYAVLSVMLHAIVYCSRVRTLLVTNFGKMLPKRILTGKGHYF